MLRPSMVTPAADATAAAGEAAGSEGGWITNPNGRSPFIAISVPSWSTADSDTNEPSAATDAAPSTPEYTQTALESTEAGISTTPVTETVSTSGVSASATMIVAVANQVPAVTSISVNPASNPRTAPDSETVATEGADDSQVSVSRSAVNSLPFWSRATSWRRIAWLTISSAEPGVSSSVAISCCTVTVADAEAVCRTWRR